MNDQTPQTVATPDGAASVLTAGLEPTAETTLCWNCNTVYAMTANQCPGCCATNANKNMESAQVEMQDKTQIDHDWKWISDWYGDPDVIGGTADCSHWECKRCGSEDCEDEPPQPYDDY